MDRAEIAVHNMLLAIEAPLYDVGVSGEREMLPGLVGIPVAEVLDRQQPAVLDFGGAHSEVRV